MTTIRSYECNFCRAQFASDKGIGLIWKGEHNLDSVSPSMAENHLCEGCIKAFEHLAARTSHFEANPDDA